MRNPRITSLDVAKRAGVSRSTVSMVINNYQAITLSAATRERVLKAAAELGYAPNSAGRNLVRGDTETIGLIISDPRILQFDGFIPQMLYGIATVNRQHGYRVLVEGLEADGHPQTYQRLVESRQIDGLIVLNPAYDSAELRALIDGGFPVVLAGTLDMPNEYSVQISGNGGLAAAAKYLNTLGHRRIGVVPFSRVRPSGSDRRVAALRSALEAQGLELLDEDVEPGDFSAASGATATIQLLARRPDLTAIFAGNDTIAVGVLSAARNLGRRVPEDLSVIGFDDLPFAAYLSPSLTTIRTDGIQLGACAAEMLIQILRRTAGPSNRLVMETECIIRASSGPASL